MSFLREFILIAGVICIGSAYSILSGLAPKPWAAADLAPGEIRYADAGALEVIWVDARSGEDYEAGHIASAVWFDLDDWDSSLIMITEHWLEQPRPIIVYCSSESCSTSREVAEQLRADLPDAEIYSLKGGWSR